MQSAVGYVLFENLIGRAQMIFFSIAEGKSIWTFWRWFYVGLAMRPVWRILGLAVGAAGALESHILYLQCDGERRHT